MQIHDLKPAPGSTHKSKRLGRGLGSGKGKTAGRGEKGHKKRGSVSPHFEGGQTPLSRRIPQLRGFKAVNKKVYAIVNVGVLDSLDDGTEVTPELLISRGVIGDVKDGVKILGDGDLTKKLTVRAHKFSQTAVQKLQAAGGTAEVL